MRYLKCESCGAIVKELVACNCEDCGIKCCGKNMVEIPEPEIKSSGKIVKCQSCNATVEIIKDCNCEGCGIKCCGEQMI